MPTGMAGASDRALRPAGPDATCARGAGGPRSAGCPEPGGPRRTPGGRSRRGLEGAGEGVPGGAAQVGAPGVGLRGVHDRVAVVGGDDEAAVDTAELGAALDEGELPVRREPTAVADRLDTDTVVVGHGRADVVLLLLPVEQR